MDQHGFAVADKPFEALQQEIPLTNTLIFISCLNPAFSFLIIQSCKHGHKFRILSSKGKCLLFLKQIKIMGESHEEMSAFNFIKINNIFYKETKASI